MLSNMQGLYQLTDIFHRVNHTDLASKRVILQFNDKKVVQGLLATYIRRIQDVEDAMFDVWYFQLLTNAVGDQLDKWGKVVNLPRQDRTDLQYRVALQVRFRAMRSQGHASDLIEIAILALSQSPTGILAYYERYEDGVTTEPGWTIQADNIPDWVVQALSDGLHTGRPGGIGGFLVYSEWPTSQQAVWQTTSAGLTLGSEWCDTGGTTTSYWAAVASV